MNACRKRKTVRWLVQVAILSALSAVVMLLEFSIPFLGPTFLKFDFSEVPVMIGAFALGPLAGIVIEALKVGLNLLLDGTWSVGIGELANFLVGVAFVLPASFIYSLHKTKKNAMWGLLAGILSMTVASSLFNLYFLLPVFAGAMSTTMDDLILTFSAAIPYITDVRTGILFGIVPFNLFKSIVVSVLVMVLYKRVSPLIKGRDDEESDECRIQK